MKMNRRNVLVGLGGIVASGGALLGTGAFSTVEANRTASISTADNDSSAYLGLEPVNDTYASMSDGQITFNFDGDDQSTGLNENALTTFEDVIRVINNGTETVVLDIKAINTDNGDNDLTEQIGLSLSQDPDPLESNDQTTIGFTFDLTDKSDPPVDNVNVLQISANVQDGS